MIAFLNKAEAKPVLRLLLRFLLVKPALHRLVLDFGEFMPYSKQCRLVFDLELALRDGIVAKNADAVADYLCSLGKQKLVESLQKECLELERGYEYDYHQQIKDELVKLRSRFAPSGISLGAWRDARFPVNFKAAAHATLVPKWRAVLGRVMLALRAKAVMATDTCLEFWTDQIPAVSMQVMRLEETGYITQGSALDRADVSNRDIAWLIEHFDLVKCEVLADPTINVWRRKLISDAELQCARARDSATRIGYAEAMSALSAQMNKSVAAGLRTH